MKNRIFAIAINAFKESMRDRILFAVLLFALFIIASSLFLGTISFDQEQKIIKDFGLTAIFLLQVFIIVFVGASLVYKEVERRTFFMILPKPINRAEVIVGKWLGLGTTIFLMTILSSAIFFVIVGLKGGDAGGFGPLALAIAVGYIESLLLIMVSILFSALTSPVLASVYTISIFLIGHSSSLLLTIIQKEPNVILKTAVSFLYYIFPNLEKFNIRNGVIYGAVPSTEQLWWIVAYAVAYGIALFIAAKIIFEKREF